MKFKKGDIVVCVAAPSITSISLYIPDHLTVGSLYEVRECFEGDIYIKEDNGRACWFLPKFFKLASSNSIKSVMMEAVGYE